MRREQEHKLSSKTEKRIYELELLNGLKPQVEQEINNRFPNIKILPSNNRATVQIETYISLLELVSLSTIVSVNKLLQFDIPRPKGILGHQHFSKLVSEINKITSQYPDGTFSSFTIKAAGSDSNVFQRIKRELSTEINLPFSEEGDLVIRFRRSKASQSGWDVLLRCSPRPSSTRDWRVENMEGALNASVAASLVMLSKPKTSDRILNVGVGSGTILIEQESFLLAEELIGIDISATSLKKAKLNIAAFDKNSTISLSLMDGSKLSLPDNYFDVVFSDLPWGQLVGNIVENKELYPKILDESYRVLKSKGKLIILTHNIKLFEKILFNKKNSWHNNKTIKINQGGLHPRIYILSSKK